MTLNIFLMKNMCVVVIALLIRREIKLNKARQKMKTQIFKEQYIPNVHAITLLLMLLLCLWLPLALRFFLIIQSNKLDMKLNSQTISLLLNVAVCILIFVIQLLMTLIFSPFHYFVFFMQRTQVPRIFESFCTLHKKSYI